MSRSYKRTPHYTTSRDSSKSRRWYKKLCQKRVRRKLKDFENMPPSGRSFRKHAIAVYPDYTWKDFEEYYRYSIDEWYRFHYHKVGWVLLNRDKDVPPTREELRREYNKYYRTK